MIDLIGRAQMEDGYFNTYYQLTDISKRFTNLRDNHELYCAGHMLEAAIAYYEATGKDTLLIIMRRMLTCIETVIGPGEGKLPGYPGHEELELALCRLYTLTGEEQALRMAKYFVDERGQSPLFFEAEAKQREDTRSRFDGSYFQAHKPVHDQETIEGHSVRALYLLSGMLDVAQETGDNDLLAASKRLFDNATQKRMYITGGVGSTSNGEAFTFDYDLPPDTVYAETCASIALIFAAGRLMRMEQNGRYADIIERALYNTCMAGMTLDGSRFFYVNPLEVVPEASKKDPNKRHVLPERPAWFGCACCPPNLARLLLSLGTYQYSTRPGHVAMHLYFEGDATLSVGDAKVTMQVQTEYPRDGRISITAGSGSYALSLRIPAWCDRYTLTRGGKPVEMDIVDGYVTVEGPFDGDELVLTFDMAPTRNYANLNVRDVAGCCAITRGPLVYCLEEVDNGPQLHKLLLPEGALLRTEEAPDLLGGITQIIADGKRLVSTGDALYSKTLQARAEDAQLRFIPYYTWSNRGENEMRVWVRTGC